MNLNEDTRPGRTVLLGSGVEWWVLRRRMQPADDANTLTVTLTLVRAGSPADPRTTDSEGA